MNLSERIYSSSLYRMLGNIVNFAIVFALTPFLMQTLGSEEYGLWLLLLATLGWFNLADLGFSSAVQREITIALEGNDNDRVNIVFSCSVILFGLLGFVASLLLFLLSFFPGLLGVEEEYYKVTHVSLMFLSIKLLWDFGMNSIHGFYSGLLRYDIDANITTLNGIVKAILIFILLSKLHIYGAVIATLVADIVTHIIKIYYARKLHPEFKFDLKLVTLEELGKLYAYSKHVVAMVAANSLGKSVDPLIISHFLGLTFVAIYGVATKIVLKGKKNIETRNIFNSKIYSTSFLISSFLSISKIKTG